MAVSTVRAAMAATARATTRSDRSLDKTMVLLRQIGFLKRMEQVKENTASQGSIRITCSILSKEPTKTNSSIRLRVSIRIRDNGRTKRGDRVYPKLNQDRPEYAIDAVRTGTIAAIV